MSRPTFTILLPVNRPPNLLPFAFASVQRQSRQDFELFIICDGAPPATAEVAQGLAARDNRIRFFAHPKGERNGELYRHQVLEIARGKYVCQIGDDDLWLPNHLAEMARLLRSVHFGNLIQAEVQKDGSIVPMRGNLAKAEVRQRMIETPLNFFGPSASGYRLSAYRSLPVGWSPAPRGMPSDLYMWRKFLRQEGLRFGTRRVITVLKLAAGSRRDCTIEQRVEELAAWTRKLEGCDSDQAAQIVYALQRPTLAGPIKWKRRQSMSGIAALAKRPIRWLRGLLGLRRSTALDRRL